MPRDDSAVDSSADAGDASETHPSADDLPEEPPVGDLPTDLAERLSSTVPSRRAYGAERITVTDDNGLLTPRERQYLKHAHRLDDDDRDAVEGVVSDRVSEFVDTDWPVIRETCPEIAATLRDELCPGDE